MQITVSGRHMEMPDDLKSYVTQKAGKLQRFYDRVQQVEVIFEPEAGKLRCELIARADHHQTFVAKEVHADAFVSLDAAVKDVERQLTRHKERFRNRKHLTGGDGRESLGEGSGGEV